MLLPSQSKAHCLRLIAPMLLPRGLNSFLLLARPQLSRACARLPADDAGSCEIAKKLFDARRRHRRVITKFTGDLAQGYLQAAFHAGGDYHVEQEVLSIAQSVAIRNNAGLKALAADGRMFFMIRINCFKCSDKLLEQRHVGTAKPNRCWTRRRPRPH
jgi:hypothetical protein